VDSFWGLDNINFQFADSPLNKQKGKKNCQTKSQVLNMQKLLDRDWWRGNREEVKGLFFFARQGDEEEGWVGDGV